MKRMNELLLQWNMELSEYQLNQFQKYYELLVEWNSFMNLTAITEIDEVILKHFVDSIALGKYVDLNNQTLLDLGTGAGFPGIPLKICYPELRITLADSLQKRIKFLNCVIDELGLQNINTCHSRAEDMAHNLLYREQFDLVTSRAVANLSTLSEYCLPFVKVGGSFIPYKSEKTSEEVKGAAYSLKVLGGSLNRIEEYVLPNSDLNRTLIFIDKKSSTPKKYPRKAGTPSKEPLSK